MAVAQKKPIDVVGMYPAIKDIKDKKLQQSVVEIWEEMWAMSTWEDIADVPTSKEIPYPNMPHTQSIVEMVIAIADIFEKYHGVKVDRDILIASAILQDASKVVEYTKNSAGEVQQTEIGKQLGHGFWCAHLAVQKGVSSAICHIIMTHSSSASKFPSSLEGKILYYADQLDVIAIFGDRWKKTIAISK